MRLPGIFILLPLVMASGLANHVHIAFSNSRTCTRMTLTHPVPLGQIAQAPAESASGAAPGQNGLVKIDGKDLKLAWGYGAWSSATTTTRDKDQTDCEKAMAALVKNTPPSIRNKSSG